MPALRSRTTTVGREAAGARALWRATGMTDDDFGKPIIAIANSYTQFVPGHVHLKNVGEIVADAVREAGGVAKEFHTIAVDDGIAMGHGGMLYSLPSREIIADSVEYMVNAHTADALVCISNCDKITPGMLNAAMRLNIPTVFVSGGPMEAGTSVVINGVVRPGTDLIDAISASADSNVDDKELLEVERSACPTCGSCSGMFTANSMNCLTEALGLSLPGNGSTLATQVARRDLFTRAGELIVDIAKRYYQDDDESVLPRNVATRQAFENAMALDMAMGGSTNTVLHILAAAQEGEVEFDLKDIDRISRNVPCLAKVAPNSPKYYMEHVHRAGGIPAILGELNRAGLLNTDVHPVHAPSLESYLADWDIRGGTATDQAIELFHAAPGGVRTTEPFSTSNRWESLDTDAADGCIRDKEHAYTVEGGLCVLHGNLARDGAILKTAGVDESLWHFQGPARRREPGGRGARHPVEGTAGGRGAGDPLRGARRRARHAGDAASDGLHEGHRHGEEVRSGHRRPLLGRIVGPGDRPRLPGGGGRRRHRSGGERRRDPHRCEIPHPQGPRRRRDPGGASRQDGSLRAPVDAARPPASGHQGASRVREARGLRRQGRRPRRRLNTVG